MKIIRKGCHSEFHLPFSEDDRFTCMDWLEWTEKTGDTRLAETAKVDFLALDSDESLL